MSKFYITTPLYYVNSKPHIGHSYTQVACDAVARFMRLKGHDVFFMTGTDEHGEKIEEAALKSGFKAGEEQRFVDGIVPVFKDLWQKLDIRYDRFIRTTDDYHVKAVQHILDELYKDGKIYKKPYKGWFCTPCETFWSETQVASAQASATCLAEAQSRKALSEGGQSPDGSCPDCKRPLEKLDEANYFLKISEYQKWLIEYINANPGFIRPDFRRNEVLGFLKEPLLDLCISRPKSRLKWGIEIPFDNFYVTYVWFDALINYISGVGYPHDMERFNKYWPADAHVIGKDILRHHAVYWPIMLKSLGLEPPRSIVAHGWWVMKGEKMSKSRGNIIDPVEIAGRYGTDPYRYFLLREVSFGLDGAFSEEALVGRYNSDLANDLGNLLNRTLVMAGKYFGGKVPRTMNDERVPAEANLDQIHSKAKAGRTMNELVSKAAALQSELDRAIPQFDFMAALTKIWEVINLANKYIEDSKPWALAKEKREAELASVISALLEILGIVAVAIAPFMPETSEKILSQLSSSIPTPIFPRIE